MLLKIFRKCGVTLLLFQLILAFSFITGCIELGPQSIHASSAAASELQWGEWSGQLRIDIDPELRSDLFSLRGDVILVGNGTLPYLMLNATLHQGKASVVSTKYLLLKLEPNRDYSFEIDKNIKLLPGDYICTLEASGPDGTLASESRKCSLAEDRENSPSSDIYPEGYISISDARALFSSRELYESDGQIESTSRVKEEQGEESKKEDDTESEKEVQREQENETYAGGSEVVMPTEGKENQSGFENEQLARSLENSDEMNPGSDGNRAEESIAAYAGHEQSNGDAGELLVASSTSKKYHLPECRYALKIKAENRISFPSVEDAKEQGYLPCKSCNP